MLSKDVEDDTRRWNNGQVTLIARVNIVKMAIPPKTIYRFNPSPIEIPMQFFIGTDFKSLKIHMEVQRPQVAKIVLNS